MDIRDVYKAARSSVKTHSPEAADAVMGAIRCNLFDLICLSDDAKVLIVKDLTEYLGRSTVEKGIGKAIANLLRLGNIFGVDPVDVILGELGADTPGKQPELLPFMEQEGGSSEASSSVTSDTHQHDQFPVEPSQGTAETAAKQSEPPDYEGRLASAADIGEVQVIWKDAQHDKTLDSKSKASLYQAKVRAEQRLKK